MSWKTGISSSQLVEMWQKSENVCNYYSGEIRTSSNHETDCNRRASCGKRKYESMEVKHHAKNSVWVTQDPIDVWKSNWGPETEFPSRNRQQRKQDIAVWIRDISF